MLSEHLITIQAGLFCSIPKGGQAAHLTNGYLESFITASTRLIQNGSKCERHTTFPAPSLKFRTSGFPQYGFKLEFNDDLRSTTYMV